MGDPTGFLKLREREVAPRRPVPIRLLDWKEVQQGADLTVARAQASRCMDCGVAFCHEGCPLGNLIPEWNDLLALGRIEEALERLHATNNFPEFTGRVCPAPCEAACVLGINQPAVTIKQSEVTIIDEGFRRGLVRPEPPTRHTTTSVGIVGSGPAGLSAAQQLTRAGHSVVVYEQHEVPGGLLRLGIPDFKLDKNLVERRIRQMEDEGTRFRCGVRIGTDLTLSDLQSRHDAVLVSTGAEVPRQLDVPGMNGTGVHFAMDYLIGANRVVSGTLPTPPITAEGKRVIVLGGGDTGSDCVGTALRQGASEVTNLAIGRRPPVDRDSTQPWPTFPTLFEISSSHEEGSTREYLASTVAFDTDPAGHVTGLRVCETAFENGNRVPHPGTERTLPADLVLLALGFTGANTVDPTLPMRRGLFTRDADFSTGTPGVFIAGDAGRGQSLIVWAMAEGRSAAAAIDRYLSGATTLPEPVTANSRPIR